MWATKGDKFPKTRGQSQHLSHWSLGKVDREREENLNRIWKGAKKPPNIEQRRSIPEVWNLEKRAKMRRDVMFGEPPSSVERPKAETLQSKPGIRLQKVLVNPRLGKWKWPLCLSAGALLLISGLVGAQPKICGTKDLEPELNGNLKCICGLFFTTQNV